MVISIERQYTTRRGDAQAKRQGFSNGWAKLNFCDRKPLRYKLVAMRTGGNTYYLLSDHLTSTAITTNSSGARLTELRY